MNDDVSFPLGVAELGWDEVSGNDLAGISDDELLEAVQTPKLLELVRVGVQWWYDEEPPESVVVEGVKVGVMTGKAQQVPPKFPG